MLHMAGNVVIRYIGVETKKLWEIGGRNVPMINSGDLILVDSVNASVLCRGRFFERVNDAVVSVEAPSCKADENQGDENQGDENQGDENQGDENPPADLEGTTTANNSEVIDQSQQEDAVEVSKEDAPKAEAAPKKKGK